VFDVFQKETGGSVLWRAAAATMEEATAHIQKLATEAPGEYVILDVRTGNKMIIKCEGPDVLPAGDAQSERKLRDEERTNELSGVASRSAGNASGHRP
jgi:hypothetical protein